MEPSAAAFCILGATTVSLGGLRFFYLLDELDRIHISSVQTNWSLCDQSTSRSCNCYTYSTFLARPVLVSGTAGDVNRASSNSVSTSEPADIEQRRSSSDVSNTFAPVSRLENIRLRHTNDGITENMNSCFEASGPIHSLDMNHPGEVGVIGVYRGTKIPAYVM